MATVDLTKAIQGLVYMGYIGGKRPRLQVDFGRRDPREQSAIQAIRHGVLRSKSRVNSYVILSNKNNYSNHGCNVAIKLWEMAGIDIFIHDN